MFKGFLRDQEDGWIKAQVSGMTNTLRFKHTTIVNLPKVSKLYAEPIRRSLVSPDGFELCGSDLSSLEDFLKQHFIYPHDPDYVKEMMAEDYDAHLSLALFAKAVTLEQVNNYMQGIDKSIKPIREIYKGGNYSCQYGVGVAKLARSTGLSTTEAGVVHKAYWNKNWAIKKVASEQKIKEVDGQMWLFNPISELWYSLRYDKDRFSTLIQSTGAYVFDLWLKYILQEREQLTFQMHDEFGLTVREGFRDQCTAMIKGALDKVNNLLKLNREMTCDIQFGKNYALIH